MNNLENALEVIGQAISDSLEITEQSNPEVFSLLNNIKDSYVVITFPEVQDYMEESWFKNEAILDVESKFGDSAYLIPLKRIL